VEEIVRALRGYGVMTVEDLARSVHASTWRTMDFGAALQLAEREGRIRRLGPDLVEIGEDETLRPGG